ncbi:S1 RNA-binding domain-containing protein [archaeon]|nr:S1 RNA-binding domain-containing protein [archaeon]
MEEYPEEGDHVIVKVKNIERYGVFVDLVEYKKEGFVHVSKITSGWVKNIRSHVSEGQLRVASVLKVDREKQLIDLSMRKVSPTQEKRTMDDWKRQKHAMKVFNHACTTLGENFEESKKLLPPIEEKYGDLYTALETATLDGTNTFKDVQISENWKKVLVEEAQKSISKPSVEIRGTLTLQFYTSNGAEKIRELGDTVTTENVSVKYISAPDYLLTVTARDYITAEKFLSKAMKQIEETTKKNKGEYKFKRE